MLYTHVTELAFKRHGNVVGHGATFKRWLFYFMRGKMNISIFCLVSTEYSVPTLANFLKESKISFYFSVTRNIDCGNDNTKIEPIAITAANLSAITPCPKQYKRSLLNIPDIAL